MTPEQAKELGKILKARRTELGLTTRGLAEKAGEIDQATIVRFEAGVILSPTPDKLARLASALDLKVADIFTRAGYASAAELPSLSPYLRTKYRDLRPEDIEKIEAYVAELARGSDLAPSGPAPGEDEKA